MIEDANRNLLDQIYMRIFTYFILSGEYFILSGVRGYKVMINHLENAFYLLFLAILILIIADMVILRINSKYVRMLSPLKLVTSWFIPHFIIFSTLFSIPLYLDTNFAYLFEIDVSVLFFFIAIGYIFVAWYTIKRYFKVHSGTGTIKTRQRENKVLYSNKRYSEWRKKRNLKIMAECVLLIALIVGFMVLYFCIFYLNLKSFFLIMLQVIFILLIIGFGLDILVFGCGVIEVTLDENGIYMKSLRGKNKYFYPYELVNQVVYDKNTVVFLVTIKGLFGWKNTYFILKRSNLPQLKTFLDVINKKGIPVKCTDINQRLFELAKWANAIPNREYNREYK